MSCAALPPTNPTVGQCKRVKQAILDVFGSKDHFAGLCCSPERADLKLCQQEAIGYLFGASLGIELLEDEVRERARKVEYYVSEEKKASEKAKKALRSSKKSARDKAKTPEALAALEQTLAALDVAAATECAARLAKVCPIEMPQGEVAAAPPSPVAPPTVDAEAAAVLSAKAALAAAEAEHAEVERRGRAAVAAVPGLRSAKTF